MTATLDGDRVVTTVEDEGPGVPPGDRERIFDKFTRLGDHLTRPQQGVGLGLYIARRSIDELGGEIWCDERPGGGARFGFTLPAHRVRAGATLRARRTALRALTAGLRLGDRHGGDGHGSVGTSSGPPSALIASETSWPSMTLPNTL